MSNESFNIDKWAGRLLIVVLGAWIGFVGNDMLRGERVETELYAHLANHPDSELSRRIAQIETEIIALRRRIRIVESGQRYRQPEE